MYELGERILEDEGMIHETSDICGELDWYESGTLPKIAMLTCHSLLAFAQGARQYNFRRPFVTPENIIDIRGGR